MSEEWKRSLASCFLIPQRYVLAIMCFFAPLNGYTMRISLNMAIAELVRPPNVTNKASPCGNLIVKQREQVTKMHFNWSQGEQEIILSIFYAGYLLTHVPGGYIADKYGGKWILVIGMFLNAVSCLITPLLLTATSGSVRLIIGIRIIMGLGQGPLYPAVTSLIAQWSPPDERAFMASIVYSGANIGTIMAYFLTGVLMTATKKWSCVFYTFGGVGALWCLLFCLLCFSTPDDHPFIEDEEKAYIRQELGNTVIDNKRKRTPWMEIFSSVPVWVLIMIQSGHDYGNFMMVSDLPKYMSDVLMYDASRNSVLSSVPYACTWLVSLISGYICDLMVRKECMSLNWARKFFTTIASIGPAVFMISASYAGCNRDLAVAMFVLSMSAMGTYVCGCKVNSIDLSPNFSGLIMGLANGIGSIAGLLGPFLVAALTSHSTLWEWRIAFWVNFCFLVIPNFVYIIFGSVEVQPWNVSDEDEEYADY